MQREMKSVNNIFGDFLVKSGCNMVINIQYPLKGNREDYLWESCIFR